MREELQEGDSPYLISARFVDQDGDNIVVVDTEHLSEGIWQGEPQQARDADQLNALRLAAGEAIEAAHLDPAIAPEVETLLGMVSDANNPPEDQRRPAARLPRSVQLR